MFLLEIYYFCSVFNNNKNKMKALYNTYFFLLFITFYFSNKVKRELYVYVKQRINQCDNNNEIPLPAEAGFFIIQ